MDSRRARRVRYIGRMVVRLPSTPLALGAHEAHVWYVGSDRAAAPEILASCERLLSADERVRARRFVFEQDRREFLIAHGMLRAVLSKYAGVEPEAWEFVVNDHGRPAVSAPAQDPPVEFNLSHTRGLAACIVAREREIGIDVEYLARQPAVDDIADRYFSTAEIAALQSLPAAARSERFLEIWTLKEAYVKARALGLTLHLGHFSFDVGVGERPTVSFAPELPDDPATWQFAQFRPTAAHVMAVAIRRPAGSHVAVRLHSMLPPGAP